MAINDQTTVNDGTLRFSDFTVVETATTGDEAGLSQGNVSGSVFDDGLSFTDFSAFASGPNSRVDAKVSYTVKQSDPLTAIQQIGAQFNISVDIDGESVSFGANGPSRDLGDIEAQLVHSVYAINEDGTKGELLGSINLDIRDPDFRDPPYEAGDFLLDGAYRELMVETSLILDTNSTDANLTLSVIENTYDSGKAPGSLSGTYFCDEDHDGVDDGAANGDVDIAGKKVELFQADGKTPVTDFDGNPVGPVTTDANGNYRFDNLNPGDYVVKFEDSEAEGKSFIDQNVGNDDAIDSDANPSTGVTAPVKVYAGEETPNVDVGVEKPVDPGTASLGDFVWFDTDKDGVQDAGEAGAAGVTVTLAGAGEDGSFGTADDISATTTTDANGKYLFDNLDAGDYKVTFGKLDGYEFTTAGTAAADANATDSNAGAGGMSSVVNLSIGEAERDVDAGLVKPGNEICAEIVRINPNHGGVMRPDQNSGFEGNTDARKLQFAVQLDQPVSEDTTFQVVLTNGTATYGHDFWFGSYNGSTKLRAVDVTVKAGETIALLPKKVMLYQENLDANNDRTNENFYLTVRRPLGNDTDTFKCMDKIKFVIEDRPVSPVALDLNQDGKIGVTGATTAFDKSGLEVGEKTVSFDIDADGHMDQIEWLAGDGDAFLFDNRDGNAINDMNGSRLFGDANGHANGYEKLAELDVDGDGMLRDAEIEGLQLWVDNGDAVLTEDEIVLLSDAGVVALSTDMQLVKDADGRELMQSVAELANGEQMLTEDVWFMHA